MTDSFQEKTEAEIRRGVLQVAVLARLRVPAYGYDLLRVLANGALPVEEGTLYPVLRRLETAGLLESYWDTSGKRPRKYYRTTDEGTTALEGLLDAWNRVDGALRTLVADADDAADRTEDPA